MVADVVVIAIAVAVMDIIVVAIVAEVMVIIVVKAEKGIKMKKVLGTQSMVGKNVFIRTVTHYYTGKLLALTKEEFILGNAAWIADTGRWAEALATGTLSEVEPYPDLCIVSRGAIVDISPWKHELPRETK